MTKKSSAMDSVGVQERRGVIYQSGPGSFIYANDVHTGRLIGRFDPHTGFDGGIHTGYGGGHNNRGLALLDDRVFVCTGDCRLAAVDRKLGT